MKNMILLVVDSLNYSHVKKSPSVMPFLQKLKAEGLSCEEMYSQAPYTEAAVMNLYCCQNVLDHGGYFFRFRNAKSTIFEEMKKHGYITYFNSFQPQCYPSSLRRGIDYCYYNVGFDLNPLWSYRLEHYANLKKRNALTSDDYAALAELLFDNFSEWIQFLLALISNDESTELIRENASDFNGMQVLKKVEQQLEVFAFNPYEFISELLTFGKGHPLFKIASYEQNYKMKSLHARQFVFQNYRPLLKEIRKENLKHYLNNCKGFSKGPRKKAVEVFKNPCKATVKEFAKSVYLTSNYLFDFDLLQRANKSFDCFKNAPSGRSHIDHYINWAIKHRSDGNHFACIHIDDIHNPEVFFSYDSSDIEVLGKELEDARSVLEGLDGSYYGSITHEMSLKYIDGIIEHLYSTLEEKDMLRDTCIAICADHGFSFSGNPMRDSFVVNLYLENYSIPFIVTGAGHNGEVDCQLRSSKDIPATLCDIAFGAIPDDFDGQSVFEQSSNDKLFIEYCGGGCPDLKRRELKMAAFDNEWFAGTLCKANATVNRHSLTELYNIAVDPEQLNNLAGTETESDRINELIDAINKRLGTIQQTAH